jgi:hypothetical protein
MDGKPCRSGAFSYLPTVLADDERARSGQKRAKSGEMAPTIEQLEGMTDAEVRAAYNRHAVNVSEGLEWHREELRRRATERQTRALIRLTWAIALFTIVLVAFEIIGIVTE